jgi:hypothetical protein
MKKPRLSLLLFFVMSVLLVPAAPAKEMPEGASDLLLEKSGVIDFLDAITDQMEASVAAALAGDSEAATLLTHVKGPVTESAKTHFAPEKLADTIKQVVERTVEADQLDDIIGWLDSPLGTRLIALEKEALSPESAQDLEAFSATLADNRPSPERLALLRELDEASRTTEFGVEFALYTQLALSFAVVQTFPKEQQPPVQGLLKQVQSERPAIEKIMKKASLDSMLYTYRDVSEGDIARYIDFVASDSGKVFLSSLMEGLKLALLQAIEGWGGDVGRLLQESKRQKSA